MAWPDSADAVIATATTQTTNIDDFISDVLSGAETTLVRTINMAPLYGDDPTWVDPGDGATTAPQIVLEYEIMVSYSSRGVFSAAAGEKMEEVKKALGLR